MKISIFSVFFLSLLLTSSLTLGQEKKIVQLLIDRIRMEQQIEDMPSTVQMAQPYAIEDGILTVSFQEDSQTIIKRSVKLSDIISLDKDMNIIFNTKEDGVIEVYFQKSVDGKIEVQSEHKNQMFFTGLSADLQDEKFIKKMLAAFKKAGYKIQSNYWYH